MKARNIASVAAAGALVIGGCSQDQSPTTSSPLVPTRSSFSVSPVACSFPGIRGAAGSYFASTGDAVYALINTMEHAYIAGGAVGATSAGFDVLARLGAAADAGTAAVTGTPAQGSTFANAVLGCMSVAGFSAAIDFSSDLGPNGLFAVRDGGSSAPVISRLVVGGLPSFGAEPSTGSWPLAGKTLFYGHKVVTSTLASETPAGDVFDLSTLPSGLTFAPEIKTGVYTISDPNARILHQHAGDPAVILPPAVPLSFCATSLTAAPSNRSIFAAATSRLAGWLAPRPAFAAPMAFGGGGAGLVGGLSEIGPVSYTSTMAWVVKPGNTSRSASPQFTPIVTVRNASANGNPLEGTLITITVTTNSGSFTITGNTAITNAAGIATFPNLKIDKPGGYLATATSEVGGSVTTKFQINGQ